jgi:fibronectin-binding autotransporter adhesin
VNGINFTNGGAATNSPVTNTTFVLNGNRIVLGGNINASAVAHDGTTTSNRILQDTINFDMTLSGNRTITTAFGGTINVDQTRHNLTMNGTIGETIPGQFITKAGGSTLTLNANNTFSGPTRINAGTIEIPFIADAGTPQPLGLSGNLSMVAGFVSYVSPGTSPVVLSNHTISMIGTGGNLITFNNNSASPNATIIYNGTLQNLPSTQAKSLVLGGSNTGNNTFNSVIADGAGVVPGSNANRTGLQKNNGGLWIITGNNTYSFQTQLNNGILRYTSFQDDLNLPTPLGRNSTFFFNGGGLSYQSSGTSPVVMANRTLILGGVNAVNNIIYANDSPSSNATLTFSGQFDHVLGANNRTFTLQGSNVGTNRFTTVIADSPDAGGGIGLTNFAKSGTGQWILMGNNTYTGTTRVNAGTLLINGNQGGATGAVTVVAAGRLGGNGIVGGATTISGELAPGNSTGTLTFLNGLTLNSNSTLTWKLGANTDALAMRGALFDGVNVNGGLLINAASISNLVFNAEGSTVNFADPFWQLNRSWLVFDNFSPFSGSLFGAVNISNDSLDQPSSTLAGTFSWATSGGDVFLNYTIPEPTSWTLVILGMIGAGLRFRTFGRNR